MTAGTWLIVGSSPSAALVDELRRPDHRVVAVSGAIERVDRPDVYVFKDSHSPKAFGNLIAAMIEDGRPVVTMEDMRDKPIYMAKPAWWGQVLYLPVNVTTTFVRGEYGNSRKSGPLGVYWAINHGATEIDIVGFEGELELQDGIPGGAYVEQARLLRTAAVGCPDVMFRYYGKLTWDIVGTNVEVIS